MNIRNNYKYKKLVDSVGKCELCGSTRNLEVHHMIPLICAIDGVDLEDDGNLIVLCCGCHSRLTNRSLLTRYGLHVRLNADQKINRFYKTLESYGGEFSAVEVMDLVDEIWGYGKNPVPKRRCEDDKLCG